MVTALGPRWSRPAFTDAVDEANIHDWVRYLLAAPKDEWLNYAHSLAKRNYYAEQITLSHRRFLNQLATD